MLCIILNKTQAGRVTGKSLAGHELNPIRIMNGSYVLPVRVLEDAAHLAVKAELSRLTIRDVAASEFIKAENRRPGAQ